MQYTPMAKIEIDLSKPLEEVQQVILMISLSQPNQLEFFKRLDIWMGESLSKIEEGVKDFKENKDGQPADLTKPV